LRVSRLATVVKLCGNSSQLRWQRVVSSPAIQKSRGNRPPDDFYGHNLWAGRDSETPISISFCVHTVSIKTIIHRPVGKNGLRTGFSKAQTSTRLYWRMNGVWEILFSLHASCPLLSIACDISVLIISMLFGGDTGYFLAFSYLERVHRVSTAVQAVTQRVHRACHIRNGPCGGLSTGDVRHGHYVLTVLTGLLMQDREKPMNGLPTRMNSLRRRILGDRASGSSVLPLHLLL
jgi:hypothetical protein